MQCAKGILVTNCAIKGETFYDDQSRGEGTGIFWPENGQNMRAK